MNEAAVATSNSMENLIDFNSPKTCLESATTTEETSDSHVFLKPAIPRSPKLTNLSNLSFEFEKNNSFNLNGTFSLEMELPPFTGRPSLFIDDGRESLGILPQFQGKLDLKGNLPLVLENPETFLVAVEESEGQSDNNAQLVTALKLLEIEDTPAKEKHLTEFDHMCELIENDELKAQAKSMESDENYAVFVEANFLASKMADNSILDISQEGGTFLDKTPQPQFIEDDSSLNEEGQAGEKKVDVEVIHQQIDKMLPPSDDSTKIQSQVETKKTDSRQLSRYSQISDISCGNDKVNDLTSNNFSNVKDVLNILTIISRQHANTKISSILANAIKEIVEVNELHETDHRQSIDEEDSGDSSSDNDRVHQLSLKKASSLSKEPDAHLVAPRRLSITFSHKNDPTLPSGQPSNNLKQQAMCMAKLWGSVRHPTEHSNTMISNDSKASSTGSIKAKLKPKKCGSDAANRGPLKAMVPLPSLSSPYTMNEDAPTVPEIHSKVRQQTPKNCPRPVAQSTPEEFSSMHSYRRGAPLPSSPLARPTRSLLGVGARPRRFVESNKPSGVTPPKSTVLVNSQQPNIRQSPKSLTRQHSTGDLPPPSKIKTKLRRCYSVGGKENTITNKKQSPPKQHTRTSSYMPKGPQETIKTLKLSKFAAGLKKAKSTI